MECSICTERYNRSSRLQVICQVCTVITCSSCVERYLCDTTENAHCMHCRGGWNRDMLETCGLSKKFVRTTYKKHRENVLFERERALMPATQPMVEKLIHIRKLEKQNAWIDEKIADIHAQFVKAYNTPLEDNSIENQLLRIENAYKINEQVCMYNNTKAMNQSKINILNVSPVDSREARKFIRACSQNGCAGFLSTAWKCGICDHRTCPDCHEPKDDEHVCKDECIKTAQLLASDTKNCPTCAALIFKIEGCDQMWCTQCATAFSWRTGRIETGRIHNPHYYDYQRQAGRIQREIGDIPCGGMPDKDRVVRAASVIGTDANLLLNIIRWHVHIELVTMQEYEQRWPDNRDLRIKFMMKDINEDVFKHKIQAREKDAEKRIAIRNVLNTYQVVMAEIMQRVVANNDKEAIREFDAIRQYTWEQMSKISQRYQCVTPRILETWAVFRMK